MSQGTCAEEAVIQVISAVDMFKSSPTKEDMTIVDPCRRLGMATPSTAVKMKSSSCVSERKHAGRALGVGGGMRGASCASSIEWRRRVPMSAGNCVS